MAALYAISLFGLVAMAGVGWDYGRLMAMDSELQNAADQAALAAATQLVGRPTSITDARAAVNEHFASADSEFVNNTRMANDGDGRPIVNITLRFFESYDPEDEEPVDEILDDEDGENANVVMATVNGREAFYALTPIVGAISSGEIVANAVAGLETATCNAPPMMFCIPSTGSAFSADDHIGQSLRLHMMPPGNDEYVGGIFGFLEMGFPRVTGANPNTSLGWNWDNAGCSGASITAEPGVRDPESSGLNTRFDLHQNPAGTCNTSTGLFCAAENVRKDWVHLQEVTGTMAQVQSATCSAEPSGSLVQISSLPVQVPNPGMPIDSAYSGPLGNGDWDYDTYMTINHPGADTSDLPTNPTRWDVYQWELDDPATRMQPQKIAQSTPTRIGNSARFRSNLYCSYPQPQGGSWPANDDNKDRRLLTVAAVDCDGLNPRERVNIVDWVDLFLLTPANINGAEKEFYTEVRGIADPPGNDSAFQYYGRNKPVLLR